MQEERLRTAAGLSERTYRTVLTRAPDMCVALERGSGRIIQCNDVVRTTLGFSPRELVGHSVLSLAHPDCSAHAQRAWQSLAADLVVPASDVEVLRKDGGKVVVRLTGATVRNEAGRVCFGIALMRARAKPAAEVRTRAESPDRLRALLYTLSVAEQRERRRIAAGLHDDLGQSLAIAKLKLGCLGVATDAAERDALTSDIRDLIDQALSAARSTTFELSSPVLEQFGLDAAIRSVGERMQKAYGLRFGFVTDRAQLDLTHEKLEVLLRVVRELLFNVHKHARASSVEVIARSVDSVYTICVVDDGVGFRHSDRHREFTTEGGFGLRSAEAQVQAIGGRFAIESFLGTGTCVTISVPLVGASMNGRAPEATVQ